jgi:hypothetical protein
MVKGVKIAQTLKGRPNCNGIIEGLIQFKNICGIVAVFCHGDKKRPTTKNTMVKSVKIAKTLKGQLNFNRIIEGSILIVSIDTIGDTNGIDPSVKNFRSLTDSIDHQ